MDTLNQVWKSFNNKVLAEFSRNNPEPFKKVFKDAKEISHDMWISVMEDGALDYHPTKSYIGNGEYGNCILIIFEFKYKFQEIAENRRRLYLQWTYQYKGSLCTKYYAVKR
ncbi:hypothetical protein ACJDU8_01075 [Clostridium sp. WILCCON 0269]|uniref:Uncharacterized protein n=1 Tax=Candidatus Clostridium eludens TaxID=3381663 RepID=A0ABW8SDU8_9CLOT